MSDLRNKIDRRRFTPSQQRALKHITNWPDAKEVYESLPEEERKVLRQLARGKMPSLSNRQYVAHNSIIEHLKEKRLVEETGGDLQVARSQYFGEHIHYNYTTQGRLEMWVRKPWWMFQLNRLNFHSRQPGLMTGFAMALFLIPLSLSIASLYPWFRNFFDGVLAPLEISLDAQRYHLIVPTLGIAVLFIVIYLFSSQTAKWRQQSLAMLLAGAILSFLFWLGFSLYDTLLLGLLVLCDLGALQCLYSAFEHMKPSEEGGSIGIPHLHNFLKQIMDEGIWKSIHSWPQPKTLLCLLLFVPGFFFFLHLLAPQETQVSVPLVSQQDLQKERVENLEATILSPSWLSERDGGDFLVLLRAGSSRPVTGTFLLEPVPGSLLSLSSDDQDLCQSTCEFAIEPGSQTMLQWRVQTAPHSAFMPDAKWWIRFRLCGSAIVGDGDTPCTGFQEIGIPKLRLGFGLWKFLEYQPLLNVLSLLFGIVYAFIEIWIGSRILFQGGKQSATEERAGDDPARARARYTGGSEEAEEVQNRRSDK